MFVTHLVRRSFMRSPSSQAEQLAGQLDRRQRLGRQLDFDNEVLDLHLDGLLGESKADMLHVGIDIDEQGEGLCKVKESSDGDGVGERTEKEVSFEELALPGETLTRSRASLSVAVAGAERFLDSAQA